MVLQRSQRNFRVPPTAAERALFDPPFDRSMEGLGSRNPVEPEFGPGPIELARTAIEFGISGRLDCPAIEDLAMRADNQPEHSPALDPRQQRLPGVVRNVGPRWQVP